MEKVEFFQIPSCKFENIASGVYSHPNSAPHTPLMLTSLKVYIYSFLNSALGCVPQILPQYLKYMKGSLPAGREASDFVRPLTCF